MEKSDGSPPPSICFIRAAESYPKPQMEKESVHLTVPFQELAGESVKYLGRTDDGILALSNYRIFLQKNSTNSELSVPLGLIELVHIRDLFHLIANCKDASTVKCSFETSEQCTEWQRRIQLSIGVPDAIESLFAFPFYSWTCDSISNGINGDANGTANGDSVNINTCFAAAQNTFAGVGGSGISGSGSGSGSTGSGSGGSNGGCDQPLFVYSVPDYSERLQRASRFEDDFRNEVERLGFDLNGTWRISHVNADFKLCPSYPQLILVPCCITDDTLQNVANFRGSRRLPAVVWRHHKSGAVIARCSQPEVGWLGWRNYKDEQLLKALADACAFDRGEQMRQQTPQQPSANAGAAVNGTDNTNGGGTIPSEHSSPVSAYSSHEEVVMDEVRKVLIVDARSYTSAVTNRARGGGCECIEYYPCAEIEFMNLGNIHVIRRSFHALRALCASSADVPNWLGQLEKTMWLQHLSGLLTASMTVCHAIEKKGRPVLVHCSDGWDRTPQIVATAQLCLDPHYRTVDGFRVLVEREWLSFGHKFSDRCGHGPGSDELNERCPVFLQWLDIVHQIHKQFPCSFEFSMGYLIKLAQHSLSCLFGTFLCNTLKERVENSVFDRTFSVWPFLSGPMYRNPLYVPNKERVLWPAHNVRDLHLWSEVYLGNLGNSNWIDFPTCIVDGVNGSNCSMTKTRSYGDLTTAGCTQNGISRRSSDPNMSAEPNLLICSNSANHSRVDIQSHHEDLPDFMATLIHDTTKKLENLTTELNIHDKNNFGIENDTLQNGGGTDGGVSDDKSEKFCPLLTPLPTVTGAAAAASVIAVEEENTLKLYSSEAPMSVEYSNCGSSRPQQAQFNEMVSELNSENLLTPNPMISPFLPPLTTSGNDLNIAIDAAPKADENSVEYDGDYKDQNHHQIENNQLDPIAPRIESEYIKLANDDQMNLMHSIDLGDPTKNIIVTAPNELGKTLYEHEIDQSSTETLNGLCTTNISSSYSEKQQQHQQQQQQHIVTKLYNDEGSKDQEQDRERDRDQELKSIAMLNDKTNINLNRSVNNLNCNILPKVHTRNRAAGSSTSQPTILSTAIATATTSPSDTASLSETNLAYSQNSISQQNNINYTSNNNNNNNNSINNDIIINSNNIDNNIIQQLPAGNMTTAASSSQASISSSSYLPLTFANSSIDESIIILPEHHKLEISINGKCETIPPSSASIPKTNAPINTSTVLAASNAQRRRRTSSSNSRRDCIGLNMTRNANGSTNSRFSLAGVRSLPMTPPGIPERPQIALSCPDGLAHALSEQNIRLQQIVHEHKIREDVLLREIHDMRMALLRKICPNCTTAQTANDEQCSALDNIENASICSWEAVEDRSGPSSSTSSSIQPNTTSVLWVPDHAVSRCTSCQTEFWLGRRKHHCRSCGQIFCADCSEFWAPLPDEKLFNPVRLCGPCYHMVTTRMQASQIKNNTTTTTVLQQMQKQSSKTQNAATNAVVNTAQPATATSKA